MANGLGDARRGGTKLRRELRENQALAADAGEQLERVETNAKAVAARLGLTRAALRNERARALSLAERVRAANAEVASRRGAIRRRLRAIYVLGDARPETALLRARSVGDLSARGFLASRLAERDRALYEALRASARRLRRLRDESARSTRRLAALTREEAGRKRDLDGAKRAKTTLLARLRDRRGSLVAAIAQFDRDEARIAAEIAAYEARERDRARREREAYRRALAAYRAALETRRREDARRAADEARERGRPAPRRLPRRLPRPPRRAVPLPRPPVRPPVRPPSPPESALAGRFGRPAAGPVTSGFGMRLHPILHVVRMHWGVDFGGGFGAPVYAARAGTVVAAETLGGYGRVVIVDHGGGLSTVYGHLSSFAVAPGARVARGQRLGAIGSSGLSTGPHLHFEVHVRGRRVDPAPYL